MRLTWRSCGPPGWCEWAGDLFPPIRETPKGLDQQGEESQALKGICCAHPTFNGGESSSNLQALPASKDHGESLSMTTLNDATEDAPLASTYVDPSKVQRVPFRGASMRVMNCGLPPWRSPVEASEGALLIPAQGHLDRGPAGAFRCPSVPDVDGAVCICSYGGAPRFTPKLRLKIIKLPAVR